MAINVFLPMDVQFLPQDVPFQSQDMNFFWHGRHMLLKIDFVSRYVRFI
jgi:hypothetical protein